MSERLNILSRSFPLLNEQQKEELLEHLDEAAVKDIYLRQAGPRYGTPEFEFSLQGGLIKLIAAQFGKLLKDQEVANYIAFELNPVPENPGEVPTPIEVMVRKKYGQTPVDQLRRANERIKYFEGILADLDTILNDMFWEWDADNDQKVGKMLSALLNDIRYREDIDRVREAISQVRETVDREDSEPS